MRIMTLMGALLLAAAAAQAGPGPGRGMGRGGCCGGWGAGGAYGARFDDKTLETLKGEVVAVKRVAPMRGMGRGVHLTLKSEKETIEVRLDPAWYLDNQEKVPAKGDAVEVRGSRVDFDGKPALIAVELEDGDMTLKLRDEDGFPLWSGWRRR